MPEFTLILVVVRGWDSLQRYWVLNISTAAPPPSLGSRVIPRQNLGQRPRIGVQSHRDYGARNFAAVLFEAEILRCSQAAVTTSPLPASNHNVV